MYSGADLDTLMTALASLTSSGFLEYDFNIGQKVPYLNITVSETEISLFPSFFLIPNVITNLYYTTDFTPPVATFISNMNAGITAAVDANATLISTTTSQLANWSTFVTTYQSYG